MRLTDLREVVSCALHTRVFVAVVALLSLCISSMRAPDAVLGVTFARACATNESTGRPTQLHVSCEGRDWGDVHALVRQDDRIKPVVRRDRETSRTNVDFDGPKLTASFPSGSTTVAFCESTADKSSRPTFADPPTRARARLMVFLN